MLISTANRLSEQAATIHAAARRIARLLPAHVNRTKLDTVMCDAFGSTSAAGHWSQRDAFEMLEHALKRLSMKLARTHYPRPRQLQLKI
jgi:hypothetical protein